MATFPPYSLSVHLTLPIAKVSSIAPVVNKSNASKDHWWNYTDVRTPKYRKKLLAQCQFAQNKFHTDLPGFDPGPLQSQPFVFISCLSCQLCNAGPVVTFSALLCSTDDHEGDFLEFFFLCPELTISFKTEILIPCFSRKRSVRTKCIWAFRNWTVFNVYWTVHHCNSWRMNDQLDVTCYFISLIMCSTCFGH